VSKLLAGRTALVTGAATGIGAACASLFAEHGARLVLFDRNAERLAATAGGLDALAWPGDVTLEQDVRRAVEACGPDGPAIVVNAAGIVAADDVETIEDPAWERAIAVNLTGTMRVCRAVLPSMRAARRGAIVNIASVAAFNATPGSGSYAPSKAGVVALTRSIALRYGGDGIRANCLCPGWTRTPMSEREMDETALANGTTREAEFAAMAGRLALKRIAEPREIASCALFLASDLASFVTGVTLVADGGGRVPAVARGF
jgi:NAD(P)-dependent dehydrogenase (short-subunit alcohol dehydrogenase family)